MHSSWMIRAALNQMKNKSPNKNLPKTLFGTSTHLHSSLHKHLTQSNSGSDYRDLQPSKLKLLIFSDHHFKITQTSALNHSKLEFRKSFRWKPGRNRKFKSRQNKIYRLTDTLLASDRIVVFQAKVCFQFSTMISASIPLSSKSTLRQWSGHW
jgi:hypothetical protein